MLSRLLKLCFSIAFFCIDRVLFFMKRYLHMKPKQPTVILFYHNVIASAAGRFANQMAFIKNHAEIISLNQASTPAGAMNRCAVTFDDAFVSLKENGIEALERFSIPYTIFVPTANLGKKPQWITNPQHRYYNEVVMTQEQLTTVAASPLCCLGSHCATHRDLTKLPEAEVKWELEQSKRDIERIYPQQHYYLSFPHGAYTKYAIACSRGCGYERSFTIDHYCAADSSAEFITGRFLARPSDWTIELYLILHGAYRWLPAALIMKRRLLSLLKPGRVVLKPDSRQSE
ncbi:MAG: polysaccharide deacetylase family protein [Chitinivibrionales bacterium]|nr:polysaccharide deacetylase family protein [Chitinivibrionales bacterium]